MDSDADLVQAGYRYALALTHQSHDAEDLVQESWINLSRRYGGVESRAVLFTAVRNLFIDQCRRKKIVPFEALDVSAPPSIAAEPDGEPGLAGDVARLLGCLRPVEREALFLHYYEGRTAEEISKLTSQPRGTVLSLLHRAIARLREEVGKSPGDPRNQWLRAIVFLIY